MLSGDQLQSWDAEGKSKREIKNYAKGNYFGIYPMMMKRLALRCKYGELKYGETQGWRYPRPSSTYFDSAVRHMFEYLSGDNTEDHLVDIKEREGKDGTYSHFAKEEPDF